MTPSPDPQTSPATWTEPGTTAYHRTSLALFLAGVATFSLLYCVQPLLPCLAQDFQVGPAQSSLALSLATAFLAVAIMGAGAASEMLGRRGVMFVSMCGASLLGLLAAVAPHWHALLAARALEGFVLGGVPAVAMAYLAEEIHPRGLGLAMGYYVAGTAFGGMSGRVGVGALTEFTSWRVALGAIGFLGLAAAVGFFLLLPPSRHFTPRRGLDPRFHLSAWLGHLRQPGLPSLFLVGALAMGTFVTIYNYASFRLTAPPYSLSPTQDSLVFVVYLLGMVTSSLAGYLADRLGRGPVLLAGIVISALGVLLTLQQGLAGIICGVAVLTMGFFISHAVASGWVGRLAQGTKGHASSLYLLAYYTGSSLMGWLGGWFWSAAGWWALVLFTLAALVLALVVVLRLSRLEGSAQGGLASASLGGAGPPAP